MFLSYSRGDRALALQILQNLRALGVDVWWDEDMPGVDWQDYLASKINELAAVLVIWTPLSAGSKNVKDEARLGQNTEKLVNVMMGASAPPFPFDRVNGLPLDGWTGREPHSGWTRVIRTVEERLVAAGGAKAGELTGALRQREQSIEGRRKAVADAEDAFADGQAAEADASTAQESARTEFAAAEAQLRSVMDMQAGPTLLRAAQQQLDAALVARTDAEQARRSAAAALAAASKSLSSAKAELERLFGKAAGAPEPITKGALQASSYPAAQPEKADGPALASSAPASPRVGRSPRGQQHPWRILAAVAGAVIVVAGLGTLALRSGAGHAPPAPTSGADAAPVESAGSAAPASEGSALAAGSQPELALSLIGRWGIAGLGCTSPVTFSEVGKRLTGTFAGATVNIRPVTAPASGVLAFVADNGARYELRDGALSVIPAGARQPMSMTRCAG